VVRWDDIEQSLVLGSRILFTRVVGMKAIHFPGARSQRLKALLPRLKSGASTFIAVSGRRTRLAGCDSLGDETVKAAPGRRTP
jgi:hypothetical protein